MIDTATGNANQLALAARLEATLHQEIPITNAMSVRVRDYDGMRLAIAAPLAPNINLHGTGFAGSLYTVAALCGWGTVYLQLLQADIEGSIVLADADIRYLAPEHGELVARCDLTTHAEFPAAMTRLHTTGKTRFALEITVGNPNQPAVRFNGRYAVRRSAK